MPGCNQETGPYYKQLDLIVGETVNFFGKELKIIGVDEYTRDFLHKMGITVADNESMPDDPYFKYRKQVNFYYFFFVNVIRMLPNLGNIMITFKL